MGAGSLSQLLALLARLQLDPRHPDLAGALRGFFAGQDQLVHKAGPMIAQRMQHWLQHEDFAGVRDDKALAELPEEERADWRKPWDDVAEMLAKAQGKAQPEKKTETKQPP